MFLDITHFDYDKDVIPFIKSGIIVDTSIIKIIIDGLVAVRFTKTKMDELPEYNNLLNFFDVLKINNRWNMFFITTHILAEICNHFRNQYNKRFNYREIVKDFLPILAGMGEHPVSKSSIMEYIETKKPIIEIGDISIFLVADNFISCNQKASILAKDTRLSKTYFDHPNILVMDYNTIMPNLLQI
jgi:hypothetical protein